MLGNNSEIWNFITENYTQIRKQYQNMDYQFQPAKLKQSHFEDETPLKTRQ